MTTETTLHSFSDITSNIATPKVTEINGVIFRAGILDTETKVLKRIERMKRWMPLAVWEVIVEADVDILIHESMAESYQHGNTFTLNNGRLCLTLDPTVLMVSMAEHPRSPVNYLISYFEAITNRDILGADISEDEKLIQIIELMAHKLERRGVIKSAEKRIARFKRMIELQARTLTTAINVLEWLKK